MTYESGSCVGCFFLGTCRKANALCPKRQKEMTQEKQTKRAGE